MIHRLTDHLIRNWQAIVGEEPPVPRRIHLMKFGSVVDFPRKYIYVYAFLDSDATPSLVLKITADRSAQAQLVREFDITNRIRSRVSPEIAATIPAPLAGLPFGSYWIGVEEVAGGERFVPVINLDRSSERRRVERLMNLVLDWVVAFGQCGSAEHEFTGEVFAQTVTEPLARLRSYYDLEAHELAYLDQLRVRFEARRGQVVTAVASHGDLWPGNLYVHDGGLRVIDWTDFRARDVTYHDLYNFLDSFVVRRGTKGEYADLGGREASSHALFSIPDRSNWFMQLVTSYIERYIERLALDRGLVQLMLPLYYVIMATRREPINESSVTINHKFRGLLGAYIRLAQQAGSFHLPGPWGPDVDGEPVTSAAAGADGEQATPVEAGRSEA